MILKAFFLPGKFRFVPLKVKSRHYWGQYVLFQGSFKEGVTIYVFPNSPIFEFKRRLFRQTFPLLVFSRRELITEKKRYLDDKKAQQVNTELSKHG